ncbi:hypothetical protein JCM11491_004396 [Sporobolomyces phaffii]
MAGSNAYLNVLRSLEGELFPVVAVERSSGTFRFEPPPGVRPLRALAGLTMIGVVGISALCCVQRRRRVLRLPTAASASTGFVSPTLVVLAFTFVNSAFQLFYLSHLPSPHHTINLVSASFRNFLLLAQAFVLGTVLIKDLVVRIAALDDDHVPDADGAKGRPDLRPFTGTRFTIASSVGAVVLLSAELAASVENLLSSLALRESFFDARMKLLVLATSPNESARATTTTILRVLAGPIEGLQRDLQRLRRSEIAKDVVDVASQVVIILVALVFLSHVSSHLPRLTRTVLLRTIPTRIRFKRASSISKLPVLVDVTTPAAVAASGEEEGTFPRVEDDELFHPAAVEDATTGRRELRTHVLALAALTTGVFLSTLVSNYVLVLDVLGRRWTAPVESFGPTRLWSTYLYVSLSLSTLSALAYLRLSSSSSSFLSRCHDMTLIPLSHLRVRVQRRRAPAPAPALLLLRGGGGGGGGYVVPAALDSNESLSQSHSSSSSSSQDDDDKALSTRTREDSFAIVPTLNLAPCAAGVAFPISTSTSSRAAPDS